MTLTEVAFYTRKFIKFGSFLLVFIVLFQVAWNVGFSIYRNFVPEIPRPQLAFGRISKIDYENPPGVPGLTYSLETASLELPKLPFVADVYFMPTTQVSFLSLDEATSVAKKLGFTGTQTRLTDIVYRFEHKDIPETLDVNIVNKTFSLSYNLSADPNLLYLKPTSTQQALSDVERFLSSASLYTDDLKSGEKTFEFLATSSQELVPVSSLSEANFIRVNLFRQKYSDLPVISQKSSRANVWFLVSGDSSSSQRVIAGEYHYFPVSSEQKSTYPIKTAQEAWDELNKGAGFIISVPTDTNRVVVRDVYLSYFDLNKPQSFLQPVVVFEGDEGFRAFVPAVSSQYYGAE